jgi:hypothetical protein
VFKAVESCSLVAAVDLKRLLNFEATVISFGPRYYAAKLIPFDETTRCFLYSPDCTQFESASEVS